MPQAKRRRRTNSAQRASFHSLAVLVAGMVIGSLATILWQGMRAADGGIGTGIRQMIDQSKQEDKANPAVSKQDIPVQQAPVYDFHTVLHEIEVVVPSGQSQSDTPQSGDDRTAPQAGEDADAAVPATAETAKSFMLQAGSYKNRKDADRLKAELAFSGLSSTIQKVTIQDRGDFYRVRLGPYSTYAKMVEADESLASKGIQTLRLKISKGG